jgi:adenine/guanine phosphoribosyltransferase-like PRPP-binding protein
MAGRKRGISFAADVSYSLSVEYAVFVKRIAYESAERHSQVSLSHTRHSATGRLPT